MPLTQVQSNNTFTDLYGDHVNNLVVFGDDSRTDRFYAHVKMEFWGENWVTFEDTTASGTPVLTDDRLALDMSRRSIEWRQERRTTGRDTFSSSLKWLITLKEKPKSNKYVFHLGGQWRDFDFLYQIPLAEEFGEAKEFIGLDGEEWVQTTQSHGIDLHVVRRLKADGSYAVYHKTKCHYCLGEKNYRTGKVLQIYRPKVTDATGKSAWVDIRIRGDVYEAIIPQKFLDDAVYPVVVNDEFGWHTVGDTTGVVGNDYLVAAPSGSPAANGQITHIAYYLNHSGNDVSYTFGLYNSSSGVPTSQNLVIDTIEGTLTADGWLQVAVDSPTAILAANTYWIAQNHASAVNNPFMFWDTGVTRYYYSSTYVAGTLPATFSGAPSSTTDRKYSAYVTYTPSAAGGQPTMRRRSGIPGMQLTGRRSW